MAAGTPINSQISKLKNQIETQLHWGDSADWSKYDFEKLSEQMAEKTGVCLSVSTLKRIFGKVNYKSEPSLTTLNTLSQFLDYADWRDFEIKNAGSIVVVEFKEEKVPTPSVAPAKWNRRFLIFVLLAIASGGIFSFFLLAGKPKYDAADFRFHSKTMLTEGLPNSVVFDFDASKANALDSVFICQTWDTRRKVLVNKNDRHHSSIYYYPGYFRAKLMIGNQIIREHDIQIKTKGWLGLVEADWGTQPLYFQPSEISTPGAVEINKALLTKYNLPLTPSPPKIRFFNQKDIKGIMTDNFTFETQLKNEYVEGANACQKIEVLLQAKNDIMIIPLVKKGCVGDIYLAAYGHYVQSTKEDLSGFGCDPKEWTTLKVECKNGLMKFYVNNSMVHQAQMPNKATEIVGVQYRFNGMGAIRSTWLQGTTGKILF
ncbi:hypothetical protein [Runella sp.]|uniref:hypothetical protein n=1 Tax=Runella sp. TaxID=1960881 RepID=UPI003D13C7E1